MHKWSSGGIQDQVNNVKHITKHYFIYKNAKIYSDFKGKDIVLFIYVYMASTYAIPFSFEDCYSILHTSIYAKQLTIVYA